MIEIKVVLLNQTNRPEILGYIRPIDTKMKGQAYTLPDNVQQLHVRQPSTVLCKTRGCLCSFRLLTMGGVSPETC